jgi:hypothetical protein
MNSRFIYSYGSAFLKIYRRSCYYKDEINLTCIFKETVSWDDDWDKAIDSEIWDSWFSIYGLNNLRT